MGQRNWTNNFCKATYDSEHSSPADLRRVYMKLVEHYQNFGERIYPIASFDLSSRLTATRKDQSRLH